MVRMFSNLCMPVCLVISKSSVPCMYAKLLQLCQTLCNLDCSSPSTSVHGVFQAGIKEWVAIPYSRGSSWSRDWTHVSLCLQHSQMSSLPLLPPSVPWLHPNFVSFLQVSELGSLFCELFLRMCYVASVVSDSS